MEEYSTGSGRMVYSTVKVSTQMPREKYGRGSGTKDEE